MSRHLTLPKLLLFGIIAVLLTVGVTPAQPVDGCSRADFIVARNFDVAFRGNNFGIVSLISVTADFNGDGKPDLAAINRGTNQLEIFLNEGLGFFTSSFSRRFAPGPDASALVVANFNGDSHVDIVATNSGNNVSVLLGLGDGRFTSPTSFGTGATAGSVATGDFNNDGKTDIVVGSSFGSRVSVLLGDGTGLFSLAAGSPFVVEGFVRGVAVADFNSDTKLDLVASTADFQIENRVILLTGNGLGSFSNISTIFEGITSSITPVDLNGDSKVDLAVGHTGGVAVLLGDGAGGFGAPLLLTVEDGGSVHTTAVGDLDGDGSQDLVAGRFDSGVTIFTGDGIGNFTRMQRYVGKFGPNSVVIADFDGDGRRDIATDGVNLMSSGFSILFNVGGGTFEATRLVHTLGTSFSGPFSLDHVIADFNADGRADMAVTNSGRQGGLHEARVLILLADTSGGFTHATPIQYPPGSVLNRIVSADFNEDGKPDLAVAATIPPSSHVVSISLSNGDGSFTAPFNVSGFGENPWDLAVADFDNDANLDLVVISASSQNFSILSGDGMGGFTFTAAHAVGTGFDRVAVGDFNGDSKQDLAITDFVDRRLVVVQNNGGGFFTVLQSIDLPGLPSSVLVDDFNADGKRDIAVGSRNIVIDGGQVSILLGNGMGGFGAIVNRDVGTWPEDLVSADLNSDGKLDIASADPNGLVSILTGDGAGSFSQAVSFEFPIGVFAIAVHDFNLDSRPDLAAVVPGLQSIAILFGKPAANQPCVFADNVTVTENNSLVGLTMSIPVRLSKASDKVVKVSYTVRGSTAIAGQDLSPAFGDTLVFEPGETIKFPIVLVRGDLIDEPDETFTLNLTEALNAKISDSQARITILDNDPPPSISINDVAVFEGNSASNSNSVTFTVSLSVRSELPVAVNFDTASGTATAANDFTSTQGTVLFEPGVTSQTINIDIQSDQIVEFNENFFVNLSQPQNVTIADGQGVGTILNDDGTSVRFNVDSVTVNETDGSVQLTVNRIGDLTGAFIASYETLDGTASEKSDYTASLATLRFEPNETTKTITIFLTNDALVESSENFFVILRGPDGAPASAPSQATITINSDDIAPGPNPIDSSDFFVRQHYRDFLNRDPDDAGLAFWIDQIEQCGVDPQCREIRRINVSAAFFLSIESQETGFLVYRMFKAAYGDAISPNVPGTVPIIRLREFIADARRMGEGFRVGIGDWELQLELNKRAYALEFVQRARFLAAYPTTMTAEEFVTKLEQNVGGALSSSEKAALIALLGSTPADPEKRSQVVRAVAEDADLRQAEFNRAFVLMQYFGYLRRNPDDPPDTNFGGWKFWLDKLNQFNGNFIQAEMVKAFISSIEYRQRFGP